MAKRRFNPGLRRANAPIIDLAGFLANDKAATAATVELLRAACTDHGFFQVTNHGVDEAVIQAAHDEIDALFNLPTNEKLRLRRQNGSVWGYSGAHADRFAKKLPWKETYSFKFYHASGPEEKIVVDYFDTVLGKEFIKTGLVYQIYCEQMNKLAMALFELVEVSLGVEAEQYYRKLFEEGSSIMRSNFYPKCEQPELVLGTGPHADPTAITILHQDQVGGLQVFSDNKWKSVGPCLNALVINLVLRAPEKIVEADGGIRKYPDFKGADLYDFTQNHHRVDGATLDNFRWLRALCC
ncbi:gibberellin 20 oxidase 3-like [Apium graveolens]|uniref:gibberellin 20 oxidase 3-like n=1 Tax=Apium graveolens TaxID=4045 RepID=UPI003D7B3912